MVAWTLLASSCSDESASLNPTPPTTTSTATSSGTPTATSTPTGGGASTGGGGAGPSLFEGELPLGNAFYGSMFAGDPAGNASISRYQNARRFMAERTGFVTAMRYNNRTLTQANIDDRCASQPGSVWCNCVDNNLDIYQCGYTLGNSYSVGNGGMQTITLQSDDGTAEHRPSGVILAEASPFSPVAIASEQYPMIDFSAPAAVEAGKLYHLVWTNSAPPDHGLTNQSNAVAAAADLTKGAIGLNGLQFVNVAMRTGNPFTGEAGLILRRNDAADPWSVDDNNLSWYEIRYDDDVWVGDGYASIRITSTTTSTSGSRHVGGDEQVRQRFTVLDADRMVDGLWMCFRRLSSVDAGDVLVRLADDADAELATATYVASEVSTAESVGEWIYVDLSASVALTVGSEYTLTLSAPDGAQYLVPSGFALNYNPYGSTSRNFWESAQAEYSSDAGSNWVALRPGYHPDRDLFMGFTLEGKPKRITF